MLRKNTDERITLEEIQKHPWITLNGQLEHNFRSDVKYSSFLDISESEMVKDIT